MTGRFAEPMARLIEELRKLPGIGTKTAQRLAFHVLRSSDEDAVRLAEAIREIKKHLRLCSVCNNITDVDPCGYCTSPTRNQRLVCVIEEPTNIAHGREDAQLQRRVSRAAWDAFAHRRRRAGAVADCQPDDAAGGGRRGDSGDVADDRRGGHGGLSRG